MLETHYLENFSDYLIPEEFQNPVKSYSTYFLDKSQIPNPYITKNRLTEDEAKPCETFLIPCHGNNRSATITLNNGMYTHFPTSVLMEISGVCSSITLIQH